METVCIILLLGLSYSATADGDAFISGAAFGTHKVLQLRHSTGRTILQAQQPCPVSFETQNYTIITSRCKGPQYPAILCCAAFKEFACPFADQLNDLSNQCAEIMFSYINFYGKYPLGLFASECKDSKRGLECPTPLPASPSIAPTSHQISSVPDNSASESASAASTSDIPRLLLVLLLYSGALLPFLFQFL